MQLAHAHVCRVCVCVACVCVVLVCCVCLCSYACVSVRMCAYTYILEINVLVVLV